VRTEALHRSDHVDDGEVRADHLAQIHHGVRQVRAVHHVVVLVLHDALQVLQGTGEDHADVRLEDRHVHQVIGLEQEARKLDLLDGRGGVLHRLLNQVLLGLDVPDLVHARLLGRSPDAARLEARHRVATDGGGLGQDDPGGARPLDGPDHRGHHGGAGVDRGLRRALVAGVRLDHDRRPRPYDGSDATQVIDGLGDHPLRIASHDDGYDGFLHGPSPLGAAHR
jgi:hypothetical protein